MQGPWAVLALYVATAAAINGLDAIDGKPTTPPPPTYNLTRALLLAEASYCTATEDQPLLPAELRKTIIVTKVVDNHATRAVVGWDASDRSLFVSFRGTENDRNWWQDAKFVKIRPYADYKDVAVERGFWRWYNYHHYHGW